MPPWPSPAAPRKKKLLLPKLPPLKLPLLLLKPLLRPLKLLLLKLPLRPLTLLLLLPKPLLRPLTLLPSNQTLSGLMQKGCYGTPFLLPLFVRFPR